MKISSSYYLNVIQLTLIQHAPNDMSFDSMQFAKLVQQMLFIPGTANVFHTISKEYNLVDLAQTRSGVLFEMARHLMKHVQSSNFCLKYSCRYESVASLKIVLYNIYIRFLLLFCNELI
ncbi:hypothetical protein HPP92_024625 [Vanilla planifolia]|uniref:Uncharacterized protein n=1 Tax=Vanilla planifolia TaxID=51239 RepID=A0A835UBN5_VANPL|nr:hypothetical protein HPP92_024625 [Vanilla planifolia]